MHMYYRAFPALMNASGSRSMSFAHETSGSTVNESRCYGAAIGAALEQVLSSATSGVSRRDSDSAGRQTTRGERPVRAG